MNLKQQNENIDRLVAWIEEQQVMAKQFPSYVDREVDFEEEW